MDFFRCVDFGGLSVLLIFNRADRLRDLCQAIAFEKFQESHPAIHEIEGIPQHQYGEWDALRSHTIEEMKQNRVADWQEALGREVTAFFTSNKREGELLMCKLNSRF
jgi:hypothetical protein